jgi:predicted AAA+ superfamily ATPase
VERLKRTRRASSSTPELFYWRTASGQEVDVVLGDRAGRVVGVEVKAAATLSGNDVRGLQALAATVGKNWLRGVVLYTGTEVIPFSANLHGVPMSRLWSA